MKHTLHRRIEFQTDELARAIVDYLIKRGSAAPAEGLDYAITVLPNSVFQFSWTETKDES